MGLGLILGPMIGAMLYYLVGYFYMFIIIGGLVLLIIPVLITVKNKKKTEINKLLFP